MTLWLRRLMLLFVVALATCMVVPDTAFSKPGRSRSRSRSRPRSRARSKPRASKPRASKSKKNAFGSNKNKTAKAKSKADTAAYQKAKKSGKAFKTRKEATNDFKKRNKGKYGSKYASKPAKRPEHIPQSTQVGGKTVNITYNQGHGGYGYMGLAGTWMMYDMMSDAVMRNSMMNRGGYYVGGAPPVYVDSGCGAGSILGVVFLGGIFIVIVVVVIRAS